MATRDGRSQSQADSPNGSSFTQFARSEPIGPPSIISSRMTDIASDDGDQEAQQSAGQRKSNLLFDQSRPGTARTGISSSRGPWQQGPPLRRGLSQQRGSISGSVTGSSAAGRPASSASRSHVPSLTSHAFFHPMNAQKLQAQRGVMSRPSTMSRQITANDEPAQPENGNNMARHSLASNPVARLANHISDDVDFQSPPSRGTEITEGQETYDRVTANTSPTQGHYPAGSLTESIRPLHKKPGGLTIDVNKGFKPGANLPTPQRTPRSFRSSFLLPSRNGSGSKREMQGGEKLDSVSSSPQHPRGNRSGAESPHVVEKVKAKLGHNYEYFDGNTAFFLGGRFQNTKDRPVNIATGGLVVVPSILFFIFCCPWIWDNISPAVPIIFAYVFYISISSFTHASACDPGILPRNLHRFPPLDPAEDPLRLGPPTNDWTLVKSSESSAAAMEVPTKYCKTCNIWRPPRTHHCRLCDNCVETQDHHCVWLNNCIGRRNYRFFFTFLVSTTFLSLFVMGASLAQLVVYSNQQGISFGESIDHFRVPFALVIIGFLGFLYPAALMGYHLFLMARGETTREYLNSHKFIKKERYRPFNQGNTFKNWWVVLCRPRPPTYLRFKEAYVEGDQRLGARRMAAADAGKTDSKEGMEMQAVKAQEPQTGFQGPAVLWNESGAAAPRAADSAA